MKEHRWRAFWGLARGWKFPRARKGADDSPSAVASDTGGKVWQTGGGKQGKEEDVA